MTGFRPGKNSPAALISCRWTTLCCIRTLRITNFRPEPASVMNRALSPRPSTSSTVAPGWFNFHNAPEWFSDDGVRSGINSAHLASMLPAHGVMKIPTDFDEPPVPAESPGDGTPANQHTLVPAPDGGGTRSTGNPIASEASFAVSKSQAALVGAAVEGARAWAAAPSHANSGIARLNANKSMPFTETGFHFGLRAMSDLDVDFAKKPCSEARRRRAREQGAVVRQAFRCASGRVRRAG